MGNQFDCEKQYDAYRVLNASNDDTYGIKVYRFIRQLDILGEEAHSDKD